jgi:cell division protein FtsZ
MEFEIREDKPSIIKVIGVGGAGCNAVTHMYRQGITGVNFIICNTDQQALDKSPVPMKVKLGPSLTDGLGAGANPEIGRKATLESADEIRDLLADHTRMVFVTAGMGGGTGTGGAPVVAKIAKEMGILTVGIVTIPFSIEGARKHEKAMAGVEELKQNVDALILISNNKLKEIYGNLKFTNAFAHADNVLTTAARGISEIITKPGLVNVDFEDVKTVMQNSGVAIMGTGIAEGENRALRAIDNALSSQLLDDNDIMGARGILLNVTSGKNEVTMDEFAQITEYLQQAAGNSTEIIWGVCTDEELDDEVAVTVIATGFQPGKSKPSGPGERIVHTLEDSHSEPNEVEFSVSNPQPVVYSKPEEPRPRERVQETPAPVQPVERPIQRYEHISPQPVNKAEEPQINLFGSPEPGPSEAAYQRMMKEKHSRVSNMAQRNLHNSPGNLFYLENQPAFERRNVQLNNKQHSSESNVSRYTLDLNGEEPELKSNNRFLDERAD